MIKDGQIITQGYGDPLNLLSRPYEFYYKLHYYFATRKGGYSVVAPPIKCNTITNIFCHKVN